MFVLAPADVTPTLLLLPAFPALSSSSELKLSESAANIHCIPRRTEENELAGGPPLFVERYVFKGVSLRRS